MCARYNGTVRLPPSPIVWRCSGHAPPLVEGGRRYAMAGCQSAPGSWATVATWVEFSAAHPPPRSTMTVKRSGFRRGEGLAMRRSRGSASLGRSGLRSEGNLSPSLRRSGAWVVRLSNGGSRYWPRAAPPSHCTARSICNRPKGAGSGEHGKQGTGARSSPEAAAREVINDVKQQVGSPLSHRSMFTHNAFSAWLICAQRMAWGTVPGNVTIEAGP